MTPAENIPEEQNEPILLVIQKLKNELIAGKSLDEETRLECVHVLRLDGYKIEQIAQLLKMSDRNVRRDTKKLKERTALVVDEKFSAEFLGEIKQRILNSSDYLIRLSRSKETDATNKILGETAACKLLLDLAKLLQSTGDVRLQPQSIDADVYHHLNKFSEQDIINIEIAAKESTGLPENLSKIFADIRTQMSQLPQSEQKEKINDKKTC